MPAATNDSSVRKETLIAEPQPLLLTPAAYAGLAKLVAFVPGLLMTPATEASRIALGSVLAVSVVVLGWAMTCACVRAIGAGLAG